MGAYRLPVGRGVVLPVLPLVRWVFGLSLLLVLPVVRVPVEVPVVRVVVPVVRVPVERVPVVVVPVLVPVGRVVVVPVVVPVGRVPVGRVSVVVEVPVGRGSELVVPVLVRVGVLLVLRVVLVRVVMVLPDSRVPVLRGEVAVPLLWSPMGLTPEGLEVGTDELLWLPVEGVGELTCGCSTPGVQLVVGAGGGVCGVRM